MKKVSIFLFLMVCLASIGTITASNTILNTNSACVVGSQGGDACDGFCLYSYVANANTGVFHRSSCYYVDRMASYNKVYYNSRKAAVNAGYRPCKVCHP